MANTTKQFKNESLENRNLTEGNDLRSAVGDIVSSEKVEQMVNRAQEGANKVMEKASEVAGQLQSRASDAVDSANEYLRRYPLQSVLVGFGVGILLGALLSPKRLA